MAGTPAAQARTTVARASTVRLVGPLPVRPTVLDHAVRPDGGLELVVAGLDGSELDDAPVTAQVSDVSPVPSRDRVRAEVRIAARLQVPNDEAARRVLVSWARHRVVEGLGTGDLLRGVRVLRLTPVELWLTGSCGCFAPVGSPGGSVDLDAYRAARADPLALVENEWLGHLVSSHAASMAALARVAGGDHPVVPHTVDRRGLVFRRDPATGPGCRDVRLDFDHPVACLCEATAAWDRLVQRWLAPREVRPEP